MNIGRQVWNAVNPGAAGVSEVVDTGGFPNVTAIGNSAGATTITLQLSQDGVNFYDGPNQVLAGAGDFRIDDSTGARYVRLKTSAGAVITAHIAAKR